jgi:DNA-binding NarL/FixJ family response regulator
MKPSLLLVDDEAGLRRLVRLLVTRDGRMEVVGEAADGHEALDRVDELDPDVVLLDLGLPTLDGLEVLARLQGRARPKVVVLTGFDDPATHARARELGAAACLVKGRDFERVLDVLVGDAVGGGTLGSG